MKREVENISVLNLLRRDIVSQTVYPYYVEMLSIEIKSNHQNITILNSLQIKNTPEQGND